MDIRLFPIDDIFRYIVGSLGGSAVDPLERYHEKARSIDDIDAFPSPGEMLAAWDEVTPRLTAPYHLGQMYLLRRIHGLPAAEWPRSESRR